ncbi:MAG: class I SAM-dependent methyltransferase [Candidatus Omnitrophica bacterium]|nr:class I SAM-dependent methyltransferase [Candidatus Omnitrophota bacterium]
MKTSFEQKHITVCPVCDHSQWKNIYTINEWTIDECTQCKFARIDPLPVRIDRPDLYTENKITERNTKKRTMIQRVARRFKSFFNNISGRNKNGIFLKKLQHYLPQGGVILDGGCGAGGVLLHARDHYECHGIEISSYLVNLANQNKGLNVRLGDLQSCDFGAQKFDAITLVSIIEHLDNPLAVVQRCHELLKPNGIFLLKTPNYQCWNRFIKQDQWVGLRPPDHIVYFSPSNLKQILKKAGFRKIKITAYPLSDNMYCDAIK